MTDEERTRYEVLFEDIQSNVRAIAEGHVALVERMDCMEAQFARSFQQLEHRVMKLEVGFAELTKRFEKLEAKVDMLEAKVEKLVTTVDTLVTTVNTLVVTTGKVVTTLDKLAHVVEQLQNRSAPPRPPRNGAS